jgi:hypothetical protein
VLRGISRERNKVVYFIKDEQVVFGSTGRVMKVFEGILGMSLLGLEITAGHDCYPMVEGKTISNLADEERAELAEYMIRKWRRFGKGSEGEE